jgi:putative SOS response-associated peptidase YedK
MCYYNGMKVTRAEYIRLMQLEKELKFSRELASGFDYSDWPIIKPKNGGKDFDIVMAHWELIAPWVKSHQELAESRKKFTTLNATAEKLLESKMFREAALKRRCLVLSSHFFEWRHYTPEGSKKDQSYPYCIRVAGADYFFMAGIWQPWVDRETGETIDTFAIVTTKANSLMQQVNNKKERMPTILPEELAYEWIQDGLSKQRIQELAGYQYDSEEMSAYTIQKDFRTVMNPLEAYDYAELPYLE